MCLVFGLIVSCALNCKARDTGDGFSPLQPCFSKGAFGSAAVATPKLGPLRWSERYLLSVCSLALADRCRAREIARATIREETSAVQLLFRQVSSESRPRQKRALPSRSER